MTYQYMLGAASGGSQTVVAKGVLIEEDGVTTSYVVTVDVPAGAQVLQVAGRTIAAFDGNATGTVTEPDSSLNGNMNPFGAGSWIAVDASDSSSGMWYYPTGGTFTFTVTDPTPGNSGVLRAVVTYALTAYVSLS